MERKSLYEIIQNYSEYSSIVGLLYVFMPDQTAAGKLFWITVIVLMLVLGMYWSIVIYQDWQDQVVITTASSTALPVTNVEFPAGENTIPLESIILNMQLHVGEKKLNLFV